jgi:hypothetical protein
MNNVLSITPTKKKNEEPKNKEPKKRYIDDELEPYSDEDAMEYEERLKQIIKRRKDIKYYEKR